MLDPRQILEIVKLGINVVLHTMTSSLGIVEVVFPLLISTALDIAECLPELVQSLPGHLAVCVDSSKNFQA